MVSEIYILACRSVISILNPSAPLPQYAKPLAAMVASIAERRLLNIWRSPATAIYKNWLSLLTQKKKAPLTVTRTGPLAMSSRRISTN
jgi:hypothetical protein